MGEFGKLSEHLGYRLRRADVLLLARIAEVLSDLGLTPARATGLAYVAHHAGCDQMALGRAFGINRASTMKLVNALVALGLVERRPGRDRRSNALHVTPDGEVMRLRVEDVTGQADELNFSVLDDGEKAALRAILDKLTASDGDAAREPAPVRLRAV